MGSCTLSWPRSAASAARASSDSAYGLPPEAMAVALRDSAPIGRDAEGVFAHRARPGEDHDGMRYEDLGPDYYERRAGIRRQIAHHVGKLGALGFEVTLCRIPTPEPGGTTGSQTA
jgi:hypothetical protein